MSEREDYKTDKLFQASAERHEFAYNPDAWAQMEVMLDTDVRLRRWKWVAGIIAALTSLTLILLWLVGSPQSEALSPVAPSSEQGSVAPVVTKGTKGTSELTVEASISANKDASIARIDASATRSSSGGQTEAVASNIVTERMVPNGRIKANTTSDAALVRTGNDLTEPPKVLGDLNDTPSKTEVLLPTVNNKVVAIAPLRDEQEQPFSPVISTAEQTIVVPAPSTSGTALFKPQQKNSIAVSVGAGLIYGLVSNHQELMAQPRYTAEVSYRTGKRFAIASGASLNAVCYKGGGEIYSPKDGPWIRGIEPSSVLGQCRVLEVPLMLQFYPNGSRNNGFYGSAGATSYFMLMEKYSFTYDVADSDLKKAWEGKNANNHLFGMGQFNLGYQRQLGGGSAVRIESYLQLPLTGIGQGQVNLMSAGVTVGYLFDTKKR